MIELKIKGQSNREAVIVALVESGYTVRVVQKPEYSTQSLIFQPHYVQIMDESEG